MKKEMFIEHLVEKTGQAIEETFYLKEVSLKQQEKQEYIEMVLQDKTGVIKARTWDMAGSKTYPALQGKPVCIQGIITKDLWNNLSIILIHLEEAKEWLDSDLFNGISKEVRHEYEELLFKIITSVEATAYRKLLEAVFEEIKESFFLIPGSIRHHCYNGGLLVYTVSLVLGAWRLAKTLEQHNQNPLFAYGYNQDLMLTAGLLHGIGLVYELEPLPNSIRKEPSYYVPTADLTLLSLAKIASKKGIELSETEEGILFHTIQATWNDVKPCNQEGILLSQVRNILVQEEWMGYQLYHHEAKKEAGHMEYVPQLKNYLILKENKRGGN